MRERIGKGEAAPLPFFLRGGGDDEPEKNRLRGARRDTIFGGENRPKVLRILLAKKPSGDVESANMGQAIAVAGTAGFLFRACALALFLAGGAAGAGGFEGGDVAPREAAALIRENASVGNFVVLDVRTPEEFGRERIAGAVLVDYRSGTFRDDLARLDRGKTYLVYCRTGNRSGSATAIMRDLGFGRIHHLAGGITKWKEEGLPTVKVAP